MYVYHKTVIIITKIISLKSLMTFYVHVHQNKEFLFTKMISLKPLMSSYTTFLI